MDRRQFLSSTSMLGLGLVPTFQNDFRNWTNNSAVSIAMWDFSWLERKWSGAGYEDWDVALMELKNRGYKAVRIDPFPHLLFNDPSAEYLLKPHWNNQSWGSSLVNKVTVLPNLLKFLECCSKHGVLVGLSSWWREDEKNCRMLIDSPSKLAAVWIKTLDLIRDNDLLDTIWFVDLSNEWPIEVWTPFEKNIGSIDSVKSKMWMTQSINLFKRHYPFLPCTFSIIGEYTSNYSNSLDLSMLDFIEAHIWMSQSYDGEYYKNVGYNFERFSDSGYNNLALKGEQLYMDKKQYWHTGLLNQIQVVEDLSLKFNLPLITTECWGIVDFKDGPLLNWDWVKELCSVGVRRAVSSGRWVSMATSNFCGPQFIGMWRDKNWHLKHTSLINNSSVDTKLHDTLLMRRLLTIK